MLPTRLSRICVPQWSPLLLLAWFSLASVHAQDPDPTPPADQLPPTAQSASSDNKTLTNPDAVPRMRFNFRSAPWEQVLQWLADQSGLSFSGEVIPRGTFNYVDQEQDFTPNQAIDLVNGYLLVKGYALVRHDRMLLVIDLEEDLDRRLVSELVTEIPLEQLDERGRYEILKTRFPLKQADAKIAEQQISPLLSPVGSLIVMPEAKQIVATDSRRHTPHNT